MVKDDTAGSLGDIVKTLVTVAQVAANRLLHSGTDGLTFDKDEKKKKKSKGSKDEDDDDDIDEKKEQQEAESKHAQPEGDTEGSPEQEGHMHSLIRSGFHTLHKTLAEAGSGKDSRRRMKTDFSFKSKRGVDYRLKAGDSFSLKPNPADKTRKTCILEIYHPNKRFVVENSVAASIHGKSENKNDKPNDHQVEQPKNAESEKPDSKTEGVNKPEGGKPEGKGAETGDGEDEDEDVNDGEGEGEDSTPEEPEGEVLPGLRKHGTDPMPKDGNPQGAFEKDSVKYGPWERNQHGEWKRTIRGKLPNSELHKNEPVINKPPEPETTPEEEGDTPEPVKPFVRHEALKRSIQRKQEADGVHVIPKHEQPSKKVSGEKVKPDKKVSVPVAVEGGKKYGPWVKNANGSMSRTLLNPPAPAPEPVITPSKPLHKKSMTVAPEPELVKKKTVKKPSAKIPEPDITPIPKKGMVNSKPKRPLHLGDKKKKPIRVPNRKDSAAAVDLDFNPKINDLLEVKSDRQFEPGPCTFTVYAVSHGYCTIIYDNAPITFELEPVKVLSVNHHGDRTTWVLE